MHKTLTAASLLLASSATFAGPYLGLGVQSGQVRIEDSDLRDPVIDGQAIDSDSKWSSSARLLAGYRFSENWALEFTFGRAVIEDGIETRIDASRQEEWESEIKANQFSLAPVYSHRLGQATTLRFTAGLLFGDYDLQQLHAFDVDDAPDVTVSRVRSSESTAGGLVGLGLTYQLPWKVELVTEVQHQRTRLLSNTAVTASAVYRF
jgi:accessory colonization factor AcfA